jgi:ribonuclease D
MYGAASEQETTLSKLLILRLAIPVISTSEELAGLLPVLESQPAIALDTEADSLHAYPEKLCLIQVSAPGHDALIDPLAGLNLDPLFHLLKGKELILHGADYDLRMLYRTFRFIPEAVFDTMWAARLSGHKEFGLRYLVRQYLGVALEKGPQKMNWALRPLTERMSAYALNDTRYLLPLAQTLRAQLDHKGRLAWLQEICQQLIRECTQARSEDPESQWRIKGSERLDRPAMAVLRELWLWREEEARAANKPPYFILSHERLVAVAAAVATGKSRTDLVPQHLPAKRAGRFAVAIDRALKVPPSKYPQPKRSRGHRLTPEQQIDFGRFKQIRDARAQELGIDPTVIASKGDLMSLAQHHRQGRPGALMQWQMQLLCRS